MTFNLTLVANLQVNSNCLTHPSNRLRHNQHSKQLTSLNLLMTRLHHLYQKIIKSLMRQKDMIQRLSYRVQMLARWVEILSIYL
jgi:hypothetical protein